MTTSTRRSYFKYSAIERAKVYSRIIALYKTGFTLGDIASRLDTEGFKTSSNQSFLTERSIINTVLCNYRKGLLNKYDTGTAAATLTSTTRLPETVVGILTDPALNPNQKIKMISAYAEL